MTEKTVTDVFAPFHTVVDRPLGGETIPDSWPFSSTSEAPSLESDIADAINELSARREDGCVTGVERDAIRAWILGDEEKACYLLIGEIKERHPRYSLRARQCLAFLADLV